MKPFTNRITIAPCLILSLFFADFARVDAATPGQGKKPVPKRVQKPHAPAPRVPAAPVPRAAPKRPASAQPQKKAPSPKQAPAPKRPAAQNVPKPAPKPQPKPQVTPKPAPATTPEAARARQQQNQPKNTPAPPKPDTEAQKAAQQAARARQAERVADGQEKVRQNQEAARQNQAERQQKLQENQADRARRVQDNQQKAQDNAARLREQQQDNQARLRENQDRLRQQTGERVAENQARIRDAQQRARQAQDNLNSRKLENLQQRRDAYNNARQLAAEARRPILERPSMNFRPGWARDHDPAWQNRWGNAWNQAAQARAASRVAGNYQRAVNWSYQPNYWGSRPWWNNNVNQGWYRGSWNYGWNRSWQRRNYWYAPQAWPGYYSDRSSVGSGIAWGLAAWGLGSLIYDTGYETYYNPYPARYAYADTEFAYDEPFSTIAARYPSGDDEQAKTSAEKSSAALENSRAQFKDEDYMAALKSVDEAIAFVPGDSSLHEYRALILFALGRYGDAAGVLNTVLASSPGWDYKTMIALYRAEETYNNQLMKLENYVDGKPDAADARFVLGYHHMVGGDLESAGRQFEEVVRLQPRDSIAKQLLDLVRSSVKDPGANSEPVEGDNIPDVAPIAAERLTGHWTSDRGSAGKVELDLKDDGHFTWIFERGGKGDDKNLSGTYSIDDRGLLVLSSDNSQMVGEISMPADGKLVFVLAGGPDGDPGLNFTRN